MNWKLGSLSHSYIPSTLVMMKKQVVRLSHNYPKQKSLWMRKLISNLTVEIEIHKTLLLETSIIEDKIATVIAIIHWKQHSFGCDDLKLEVSKGKLTPCQKGAWFGQNFIEMVYHDFK